MYDIEGMMGRVNDTYKTARGNSLAGLAFNSQGAERQSALGQLAGINPMVAQRMQNDFNEQDATELAQFSQMILAAPDEIKPQMYERGKQKFAAKIESLGGQVPATVQEALPFFQQLAGAQQGATKVHSQYMGDDGNMRVIMSDGSEKAMGRYSPKYTPHYGADGSVSGYNPRTNELASTTVPNGAAPESPDMAASAASQVQAIYNKLVQGGMDSAKAEEVAFSVLRESGVIEPQKQARVSVAPPKAEGVPAGYRMGADGQSLEPIPGGPADPAIKAAEQSQSLDSRKATEQRAALRQDAINFASAWLGKTPEEVAQMSPQAIREAVAKGGRITTGPIMGSIWGMNKVANADLEAYKSSAAAKQARINNPSGPVTEGDFRAAEKSVFSPDKPAQVNADLIYQALTSGGQAAPTARPKQSVGPKPGEIVKGYRFKGGNPADPNSWIKAQ